MMVLLAIAFSVLVGMVGLAVDVGFISLERRTLQKAADAAAVAGALDLADTATYGWISRDVDTLVARNGVPGATSIGCSLVDSSNTTTQAGCGVPTSSAASGVRVLLVHTRENLFMGVLGIPTSTITANATAQVVTQRTYEGGNTLFLLCGLATKKSDGTTLNILNGSYPNYTVNPAALTQEFMIHNSSGKGLQVADCGLGPNKFMGLADTELNTGAVALPGTLYSEDGNKAGPTRAAVEAVAGCQPADYKHLAGPCLMMIPILDSHLGANNSQAWRAVMWLPFMVTQVDANTHTGVLQSNRALLRLQTTDTGPWSLGGTGLLGARLVG